MRGSTLLRFGLAVAAPALAIGVDVAWPRVFVPEPFMPLFIAVLVCAWIGGFPAGALATAIGGVAVETFVITPFEAIDPPTLFRLATFLTIGLLTSALVASLQRARERAERSESGLARLNVELDQRVRERTVRLQSSIAELEAFGHDVAHTLRAPLRAMGGMAEIVLDEHGDTLPPETREHLVRIGEASRTMDARITALLEYSRLGRRPVELSAVAVRPIVLRAVDTVRRRRATPVDHVTVEAGGELVALADPVLLQRVIDEVVGNALLHRRANAAVHARVRIEHHREFVRIAVQDDGPGIEARHQDRIFGMFERLHSDNRTGFGSGLAIARRALARMSGRLAVESEPGVGSTFWIEVPAAQLAPASGGEHGAPVGRADPDIAAASGRHPESAALESAPAWAAGASLSRSSRAAAAEPRPSRQS